jgi:hypothetical protein
MNCGQCGKAIPARQLVRLNDTPLHAEDCFQKALRGLRRPDDFFSAEVSKVEAETAYRLGLQTARALGYVPLRRKKGVR